jgi:hypothetical protein
MSLVLQLIGQFHTFWVLPLVLERLSLCIISQNYDLLLAAAWKMDQSISSYPSFFMMLRKVPEHAMILCQRENVALLELTVVCHIRRHHDLEGKTKLTFGFSQHLEGTCEKLMCPAYII